MTAAADHRLAVGGEGIGVVGVARVLAALDGGDDRATLHHVEQVEIAELPARPGLQAKGPELRGGTGEALA